MSKVVSHFRLPSLLGAVVAAPPCDPAAGPWPIYVQGWVRTTSRRTGYTVSFRLTVRAWDGNDVLHVWQNEIGKLSSMRPQLEFAEGGQQYDRLQDLDAQMNQRASLIRDYLSAQKLENGREIWSVQQGIPLVPTGRKLFAGEWDEID